VLNGPQTQISKGWDVRTQIGVSDYRIDLGVRHPDHAGAWLAGVECDCARYHSSATARDRDRVRQAVLEGLGWKILLIWSDEWFRAPQSTLESVDRQLHELLEKDCSSRKEEERRQASAGEDAGLY
jgi:very-short-patch-repair endonuclease